MATMVPIQTITVGATSVSSVSFTSIPQTYTDLHIKMSTRCDGATNGLMGAVRFNSDTGSNYSDKVMYTNGNTSTLGSANNANNFSYAGSHPGTSSGTYYFGANDMYIPNYTLSRWKNWHCDGGGESSTAGSYMAVASGNWMNTAAITSITLFPGGGYNFVQNSVFTLYGIKNS
jgi:hypothetical protein